MNVYTTEGAPPSPSSSAAPYAAHCAHCSHCTQLTANPEAPGEVACPDPAEPPPQAPLDKLPPLVRQPCRAKDICHMNPWPSPKASEAQAHSQHGAKVSTTRKQKMPPKNCPNAASPTWQRSSPDVSQGHRPTGDTGAAVLTGPSALLGSTVGFPVSLAVMTHLLSREERESDRFPQNSTHVNRRETANKKLRRSGSPRTAGPLQVQILVSLKRECVCTEVANHPPRQTHSCAYEGKEGARGRATREDIWVRKQVEV